MAKLASLEILTKNNTTHTSPVILVSRKGTKNKRLESQIITENLHKITKNH